MIHKRDFTKLSVRPSHDRHLQMTQNKHPAKMRTNWLIRDVRVKGKKTVKFSYRQPVRQHICSLDVQLLTHYLIAIAHAKRAQSYN